MNRCYECGKRDWRIGSTYQAIRNWFRLKVGLDACAGPETPKIMKGLLENMPSILNYNSTLLARDLLRDMADRGSLPKAGERVTWRPRQFYDTNKGNE